MNTASSLSQIPYTISCNGVRSRMFNVLSYSPQAGQSGTTVTIDTLFNNISWRHDVHIRIVIGHKPIHTEIKGIGGTIPNLWRCSGFVPEFEVHKNSSIQTVNVTIQAVDKRNAILDTITFGRFTYQEHGKRKEFSVLSSIVLNYLDRSLFVIVSRPRSSPRGQYALICHASAYRPFCSTSSWVEEQDFPSSAISNEHADTHKAKAKAVQTRF